MYNLFLVIHIIVTVGLIGIILVQRGRSGGLVEALGGVESIFGTKTSSFLVKTTVALAVLFFITTVSLAYISKERGKSLIDKYKKEESVQPGASSGVNKNKESAAPSEAAPANPQ